jgi:hypothetical protein
MTEDASIGARHHGQQWLMLEMLAWLGFVQGGKDDQQQKEPA